MASTWTTWTSGSSRPAPASAAATRAFGGVGVDRSRRHVPDLDAARGLDHLVLHDPRRAQQRRPDDEGVHDDAVVPEPVVVPALDGDERMPVVGTVGLADEAVGELVADERLHGVDEVGDEDLGRGRARRHRRAGLVDQLDDGLVGGQDDVRVAGLAGADQALGAPERVDDAHPEARLDPGPQLGREVLARGRHRERGDREAAGLPLGDQQRQRRRVRRQCHRLQVVEAGDDLREGEGHRHGGGCDRLARSGDRRHDAGGVDARSSRDRSQRPPTRRWLAEALDAGEGAAQHGQGELDEGVEAEDEHASLARAAARGHDEVLVEQVHRGLARGRQVVLHDLAGHPAVGDDVVEGRHHLGLRHGGERRQVVELERVRVDADQPVSVEGRALLGHGQEVTQPVALVLRDPLGGPAQPGDVLRRGCRQGGTMAEHGLGNGGQTGLDACAHDGTSLGSVPSSMRRTRATWCSAGSASGSAARSRAVPDWAANTKSAMAAGGAGGAAPSSA